jgi:hypothetical protein
VLFLERRDILLLLQSSKIKVHTANSVVLAFNFLHQQVSRFWLVVDIFDIKKTCLTAAQDRKGLTPSSSIVAFNMKLSFLLSSLHISMLQAP